jgi:hypothetical protein
MEGRFDLSAIIGMTGFWLSMLFLFSVFCM